MLFTALVEIHSHVKFSTYLNWMAWFNGKSARDFEDTELLQLSNDSFNPKSRDVVLTTVKYGDRKIPIFKYKILEHILSGFENAFKQYFE